MLKCLKNADWKKTGIFAAGVAFGTAGIKALSSNDAKKFYTNVTAAVLRAKECVMQTVTKVRKMQVTSTKKQNRSTKSVQQKKRFMMMKI